MKVLIVGATSAIAEQAARIFAARGDALHLVARDVKRVEAIAADLRLRGASDARWSELDMRDLDAVGPAMDQAWDAANGFDAVLVAHGTLGDQRRCESDFASAREQIDTNFTSVVAALTPLANRFAKQRRGTVAVISSVAGDRGRQSNYVYGAAKGATSVFLQGLRNRLHHHGVRVVTIKPGFVDTPMTAHLRKGILFASPEKVARVIVRAMDKGQDVAYVPGFWRVVLAMLRAVPEPIFKRARL